jgi:hypothetical protein
VEYKRLLVERAYIVELVGQLLELNVDMQRVVVVVQNMYRYMYMLVLVDMLHVVLLFDAVGVEEVVNIFHRLFVEVLVEEVDIVQQ